MSSEQKFAASHSSRVVGYYTPLKPSCNNQKAAGFSQLNPKEISEKKHSKDTSQE